VSQRPREESAEPWPEVRPSRPGLIHAAGFGAPIDEADGKTIADYLKANYGGP